MTRYYFNYRIGGLLEQDPDGSELPDDESALEEAKSAARELLAAKVLKGDIVDGDVFEITTSDGTIVETLPLRSVLTLT
ncbi:hypothetical protein AAIH70_30260 [Neorhizobium sp. BT27B]|uniref:DUF6894 family protein n=1 Tax=Neorhizobium sp. BT27B TaxID=3142625 RepID=UPI003D2B76FA